MKIFNKKLTAFAILTLLTFSGCNGRPITIGSSQLGNSGQKVNVSKIDFTRGRDVSAEAGGFQLLLFIPININDRHERAYQSLRAQAGSDFLSDVKIKESWTYGLVGTVYTTRFEAKAYPYKK